MHVKVYFKELGRKYFQTKLICGKIQCTINIKYQINIC